MTTTTAPVKTGLGLTLPFPVPAKPPAPPAGAVVLQTPAEPEAPPEPDTVELRIDQARMFLAKNEWSGALVFSEIVEVFREMRKQDIVPLATNVDALVEAYEDEERLADHAQEYVEKTSLFVLKVLLAAKFIDKERGWSGPPELEVAFKEFDKMTSDFRAHVLQTMIIQQQADAAAADGDDDAVDPDAPTDPAITPPAAPAPATPTEPAAPATDPPAEPDGVDDGGDGLDDPDGLGDDDDGDET